MRNINKSSIFILATALRESIEGYNFSTFSHDLLAAFVVSLVALPLSMALSIAIGLSPEHGIYTAIVAGITVPLLGGSKFQVSGPTAAFVVILAPIVSEFGLRGIIWCNLLAGFILLIFGLARLGKLINYVPYPVTTGFTSGIAVVLATISLNDFLGLEIGNLNGSFVNKVTIIVDNIAAFNPFEFAVGITTLILLFTGKYIIKFLPTAIIAIAAATLLSFLFVHFGHNVATIGSKFSYIATSGEITAGIPPYLPQFHLPNLHNNDLFTIPTFKELHHLLIPALIIATLAALESLLSATVADNMTGTKHNPNAELNAIGIGNILSALVTGIPATGAIARTATAINSGARTPLASSIHALLIMIYVLALASYISYIPIASLAGLLIYTAYRMSHYRQFLRIIKIAPISDIIVLLICFTLTVFVDMIAGVGIGMILSSFLLMQRVIDLTKVITKDHTSQDNQIGHKLPKGTVIYQIEGPLFFGTIEKTFDRYYFTYNVIDKFILDISNVPFVDISALVAIKSTINLIANQKCSFHIVCDNQEIVKKIKQKIHKSEAEEYVHFHHQLRQVIPNPTFNEIF